MKKAILGRKAGMTQVFDEAGTLLPVTVIDTSGCLVTQVKTKAKDGYVALQLAVGSCKPQNVSKSKAGHFKKANTAAKSELWELRLGDTDDVTPFPAGTGIACSIFEKGERVDITGITKGKGFQGPVRRYGFSGKNMTHGTSKYFRHTGSIGMHTYPGRVFKGKRMPGQMGNVYRTIRRLKVVDVRADENLLLIQGGIPGPKRGFVMISREATPSKKAAPADKE